MSEEDFRKIAKEYAEMYFTKGIDSTKIFKYVDELEKKVKQLEKENKKLKEENKRIFQNVNDDELLISNAMNYAELKKAEKKVEQLEKENKELNRMCELYGQSLYNADLTKAEKRLKQLENIRKEAITYIETNWITYNDSKDFTEFNEELPVFIKEINILLNILNKGSEE